MMETVFDTVSKVIFLFLFYNPIFMCLWQTNVCVFRISVIERKMGCLHNIHSVFINYSYNITNLRKS